MIKAIVALLLASDTLTELVGDRIRPARFAQDEPLPKLEYSTDGVRKVDCRNPGNEYMGAVTIGVLADSYGDVTNVVEAVRAVMDDYNGAIAGYSLTIEAGEEGEDMEDTTLNAYYKQILFDVTGTKLD